MDTRDDLPKVHYATALDLYVNMSFAFVIGSLLQFAAVHYFTKIGSGDFEDNTAEMLKLDGGGQLPRQTAAGDDSDDEICCKRDDVDDNCSNDDDDHWTDEGDWMTEDGRQVDPAVFDLPRSKRREQMNRKKKHTNAV
jgi:hypothetical protein